MNLLHWLLDGTIDISSWHMPLTGTLVSASTLLVREIVGNGFGLASALGGMRRQVWAWPVGIVGNLILFTVFVGGVFDKPQAHDLWGQAGRQVFFLAVSVYGWWRWKRSKRAGGSGDGGAITPRWAGPAGWVQMAVFAVLGTVVFYFVLRALGSWGPLADAWILTGSIIATYGMARGWTEFWLVWIAVDVVGVPLLFGSGYYPSALLYVVYGAFCLLGFVTWVRTQHADELDPPQPLEEKVTV